MLKRIPLFAAVAWIFAGSAMAQIRIALVGPMTGEYASFGEQMRVGAEQAVADINKAGGVLGQQLVLDINDDACDPKQAVSVANRMAGRKVKVVIGHYCSSCSIPASKVYAEEGILEITPASSNPAYTDKGGWNTIRAYARDDQQGRFAGRYLAEHFGHEKIAILHDNSTYGKGLADETRKSLHAAGGKEVLYAAYTPKEKDYSALVSRMKHAGISLIYIGGYHTEAGLIVRQAREQGMRATMMGGDALVSNEFWQLTGDAGTGTLMTFSPDPRLNPAAADVVKAFKDKGVNPEGYVLYTYAAIQVWAEAAAGTKTDNPRKIAAALKAGNAFPSVLGPLSFDRKGDLTKLDYVLYVWKNGSYVQM